TGTIAARTGELLIKNSPRGKRTLSSWHYVRAVLLRFLSEDPHFSQRRCPRLYPGSASSTVCKCPNLRWASGCNHAWKSGVVRKYSTTPCRDPPTHGLDQHRSAPSRRCDKKSRIPFPSRPCRRPAPAPSVPPPIRCKKHRRPVRPRSPTRFPPR